MTLAATPKVELLLFSRQHLKSWQFEIQSTVQIVQCFIFEALGKDIVKMRSVLSAVVHVRDSVSILRLFIAPFYVALHFIEAFASRVVQLFAGLVATKLLDLFEEQTVFVVIVAAATEMIVFFWK